MNLIVAGSGRITCCAWGDEHSWNMNVEIEPERKADLEYEQNEEIKVVSGEENERTAMLQQMIVSLQRLDVGRLQRIFVGVLREDG